MTSFLFGLIEEVILKLFFSKDNCKTIEEKQMTSYSSVFFRGERHTVFLFK
jgi:hypothetical protein